MPGNFLAAKGSIEHGNLVDLALEARRAIVAPTDQDRRRPKTRVRHGFARDPGHAIAVEIGGNLLSLAYQRDVMPGLELNLRRAEL